MANPYTSRDQKLLTTKAAARFLGGDDHPISISTLALWRAKGTGPAYIRIGNSIRYPLSDLSEFIQASRSSKQSSSS